MEQDWNIFVIANPFKNTRDFYGKVNTVYTNTSLNMENYIEI